MRAPRRPVSLLAALLIAPALACAGLLGFDEGAPTEHDAGARDARADRGDEGSDPGDPPPGTDPEEDAGAEDDSDAPAEAGPDAPPPTAPGCLAPRADYFCTGYDGPTPKVGPEVADEMYSFTTEAPRSVPRSLRGEFDRRTTPDAMMETVVMPAPRRRLRASLGLRVGQAGRATTTPTVLRLIPSGASEGWRVLIDLTAEDVGFTVRGLQYVPTTVRVPRGRWIELAVELTNGTMTFVVDGKALSVAAGSVAASWDVSWGAAFADGLVLDFDDVTVDAR